MFAATAEDRTTGYEIRDEAKLNALAAELGVPVQGRDKLEIARFLDECGLHYIEGGWPGANPTDSGSMTHSTDHQCHSPVMAQNWNTIPFIPMMVAGISNQMSRM